MFKNLLPSLRKKSYTQISSLRRLHDLARRRGAVGTDKVADIFEGEV